MAVYELGDLRPEIHPQAWVHRSAEVIGNVTLAADVTIWPGAVLRGDFGSISIGRGSVIEDNCVIHAGETSPTTVGAETVLGHLAHIEGCSIGDAVLIGSASVVLRGAVVEDEALVAAGALVTPGTRVPTDCRAQGVPARLAPIGFDSDEVREGAAQYRRNAARWQRDLVRIDN